MPLYASLTLVSLPYFVSKWCHFALKLSISNSFLCIYFRILIFHIPLCFSFSCSVTVLLFLFMLFVYVSFVYLI